MSSVTEAVANGNRPFDSFYRDNQLSPVYPGPGLLPFLAGCGHHQPLYPFPVYGQSVLYVFERDCHMVAFAAGAFKDRAFIGACIYMVCIVQCKIGETFAYASFVTWMDVLHIVHQI